MERFLLVLIICSLGVTTISGGANIQNRLREANRQCEEELGYNEDDHLSLPEFIHSFMCEFACSARKITVENLIGPNNTATLYNGLSKMIDEAYKNGFEEEKFTREDVTNKVERCYATELQECEFWECVEPTKEPINDIHKFVVLHNLEKAIYTRY